MGSYSRPSELGQALDVLAAGPRTIVAGGTDYYPARVGKPLDDNVLDITALKELCAIADERSQVRIGALVTWSDLVRASLPAWFDGLKQAAREIGGLQVQNAGTLCGNVCNASPAADGVPNLLALDARVELRNRERLRELPLSDFIAGNRQTRREPDELVTALLLPKPGKDARSTFLKLGARKYLVISIVMVAGVLVPGRGGKIADLRMAVGACSEVAQRLSLLEAELRGRPMTAALARPEHLAPLGPIDDIRGTADYRRDAALTLVRRALARLMMTP
jgi:CO/xanthine dehydrogenase FAD-binding subunit